MAPVAWPLLALAVALQQPAPVSEVPQRPGLTLVSAVQGDTVLGNQRGDYELAVTVTGISERGVELLASSLVRNDAGRREWLRFRRTVTSDDLRAARIQVLGFDSNDKHVVAGTTALGPSLGVMADVRAMGQAEFRVRNYAGRRNNAGTLRRVGVEAFPVLLNGQRVTLRAVHMRGQLGVPGQLRPWSFWFFDDPLQPITLKVSYGAEGAPEGAPAEWLRQVIRIDVPDAVEGLGSVAGAHVAPSGGKRGVETFGPDGPASDADGVPEGGSGTLGSSDGDGNGAGPGVGGTGQGSGTAGSGAADGSGGAPSGAGAGAGTGAGDGIGHGLGIGAGSGMARALTETCRVVVPGVYFEFDSDELNPASAPWIALVADLLQRHPDWTVTIEGHTDSIGNARYNQGLSERRAAALRRELASRHGLSEARLGTRGFGPSRPLEPNTTLEGRARNRRVELVRPCARGDAPSPRRPS